MGYQDIGFDPFLNKIQQDVPQQLNSLEFDTFAQEIPGDKITGQIRSLNNKLIFDLDKQKILYSDGVIPRVEIGETIHGPGIIIYDREGNIMFESTEKNGIGGAGITESTIDINRINFSNFVQISQVSYLNDFSLGASSALTFRSILDANSKTVLLAVPRWSLYDGAVSSANEVTGVTNNIQEISNNISWQQTQGINNNFRSVFNATILNVTGAPRIINGRIDWLYVGKLR